MRDFERLRRHLRAALLAGAGMAAACGGGGAAAKGGGGSGKTAAPDAGAEPPDTRTTVMLTPPQGCEKGAWCGPASVTRRFASGNEQRLGCPAGAVDSTAVFNLDDKDTEAARAAGQADACCYDFQGNCYDHRVIEGRPFVDGGEARVASVAPGAAWSGRRSRARGEALARREPDADLAAVLAAGWLEDALAEHASVASFARATLELMSVGAPPELLAAHQRAALDEIRHAQGAFALASRYAGRQLSAGPLPALAPREGGRNRLAHDLFHEACVGETIAALRAARALAGCQDAQVAAHLRMVARDEARHAALAWRTLAWLEDGVASRFAVSADPGPVGATLPLDPRLAAHGRLDAPALAAAARDATLGIVMPLCGVSRESAA